MSAILFSSDPRQKEVELRLELDADEHEDSLRASQWQLHICPWSTYCSDQYLLKPS
jgi:hypothetical protein